MTAAEPEGRDNTTEFQALWAKFANRLTSFSDALLTELSACQRDAAAILKELPEWTPGTGEAEPVELSRFRAARTNAAALLLRSPVQQWNQRQPGRRALLAIDNYEKCLGDLINHLPPGVTADGPELASAFQHLVGDTLHSRLARLHRKPRTVLFRETVGGDFADPSHPRIEFEGGCLTVLAEAARLIRAAWELVRTALDSAQGGKSDSRTANKISSGNQRDPAAWIAQQCTECVEGLRGVPGVSLRRIAAWILAVFPRGHIKRNPGGPQRIDEIHAHWARQLGAVEEELRLELALERYEDGLLALFEDLLRNLDAEYAELVADLDRSIEWLRRELSALSRSELPEPSCEIMAAALRMAALESAMRSSLETLPERVETAARLSLRPRRGGALRKVHIWEAYARTFQLVTRPAILEILGAAEKEHSGILQAIERAREVVAFGAEPSLGEEGANAELAPEALQNAISLLEYKRSEHLAWRERADSKVARACAELFYESRQIQKRHRLGALLYFAQQGLVEAAVEIVRSTSSAGIGAARRLLAFLDAASSGFLIYIGWKSSPHTSRTRVITRPVLPDEFVVDLTHKELPKPFTFRAAPTRRECSRSPVKPRTVRHMCCWPSRCRS